MNTNYPHLLSANNTVLRKIVMHHKIGSSYFDARRKFKTKAKKFNKERSFENDR